MRGSTRGPDDARELGWPRDGRQPAPGHNRKVTEKGLTALMQAKQFVPARLEVGKLGDAKCFAKLQDRFGETCVSRG